MHEGSFEKISHPASAENQLKGPESVASPDERKEIFDLTQKEEQEMVGGILSKLNTVPKAVKRGIMILASAGVLLSAGEAFASDYRQYGNWQKHSNARGLKEEKVQPSLQRLEMLRQRAYQEYRIRVAQIGQSYHQQRLNLLATSGADLPHAMQGLEVWKKNELTKARLEWSLKAWAAEEEYRMHERRR